MKTLNEWLNDAKEKSGSDYKTAKELNVTRQAICISRKKHKMSNETASKLAEYLDINVINIIASIESEKDPKTEKRWAKWIAAMVIMSVLGMSNNSYISKSYAEVDIEPSIHYAQLILYVILSVAAYRVLKSLKFEKQF